MRATTTFAAVVGMTLLANAIPAVDICCDGVYRGHLQGTDAVGTNIWWSFSFTLVRTDLSGKVLATQEAPCHQGDLCVKGDTLYVAVNRGRFNTETGGVSFVMSFDATTLEPKRTWKLDMPHGAGGMTWLGDHFYVIGGLPPTHDRNYVHEYDSDFRLVKRHELMTGYTVLGIQTATVVDGEFLFGIYGGLGNPGGTLRCPPDLSSFRRYAGEGSIGYARIGGRLYTATTPSVKTTKKNWTGTLRPADGLLDETNLFTSAWYDRGVPRKEPMRVKRLSLGNGAGTLLYPSRRKWLEETSAAAKEGCNTIIIDLADGVAFPNNLGLAAKGAWSAKRLKLEMRRLREMNLEPVPSFDFSVTRSKWLESEAGASEWRAAAESLIRDALELFGHPRFFEIAADGRSAEDRAALLDAVIARGYGSCPWPRD